MSIQVRDIEIIGDEAQTAVGNQVNGDLVMQQLRFVRGQPSMYLDSGQVSDSIRCHVPALNHDRVVDALATSRAVLLTGPEGCGRETTAVAAFQRLRPGLPIRRFSPAKEEAEELAAMGQCGYLIRPTSDDVSRVGRCVEAACAAGGFVAVIGTEAMRAGLGVSHVAVAPPDPLAVYRRRLSVVGIGAGWPDWDEAAKLLRDALPAEARRLAEIVVDVHGRGGDLVTMRVEAAHAYRRWSEELTRWFGRNRQPHDRVLLVAAATLAPVNETLVYATAYSLAGRLNVDVNGGGLAWLPVSELRDFVMAAREGNRVAFRRHGFAKAVLDHVCGDYPLARSDVLGWMGSLPTDEAVPAKQSNALAERFTDLAAEHGEAALIAATAQRWAEEGLSDLAFIALSRTCLHRKVGGRVRTALYDWSQTRTLDQNLKLVIARVCEPLGLVYPSIALTRLKHLATFGNGTVLTEVATAALNLARAGHHRLVLEKMLSWSTGSESTSLPTAPRERQMKAGAFIFLCLAAPGPESGLPGILQGPQSIDPGRCTETWRTVLHKLRPPRLWEAAFGHWLDVALYGPGLRGPIVRTLLDAAGPPGDAAAQAAIDAARRWAGADPADPVRREIGEAFVVELTGSWWLRLLAVLRIRLRTLLGRLRRPALPMGDRTGAAP